MSETIKRGDIYIANLDPVVGSEQGGERPVLIIQNNMGNKYSPTVIVAPITSRIKKNLPTHIKIEKGSLSKDSVILAEQMRTLDKSRLIDCVGKASAETMKQVDEGLKTSIGLYYKGDEHK